MEVEIWKPVPDYEGLYEVSNLGRVKRVARGRGTYVGRILNYSPSRGGYMRVKLMKNGTYKKLFVNRLVLLAFVGTPPLGYLSLHGDDNPQNNCLNNLRWGTYLDNSQDKRVNNRNDYPLTKTDVLEIRNLALKGISRKQLAKQFCVGKSTINDICWRRTWKWL